ncbi:Protein FAM50 [Amphibalanus amphitrite]|uniref:Protein FAM50 homolog n=1 Tax=Amphibalanus amphitrite TaxID=1232801 RepID=A0A6A4WV91_AMPAM|nr:Protein FAM50 [Amphibalanus amphitrite]
MTSTIGLVTLDEMKARQEKVVQEREQELAKKQRDAERERQKAIDAKQAKKDRQKKQIQSLSFNPDEDEEDEEGEEDEDKSDGDRPAVKAAEDLADDSSQSSEPSSEPSSSNALVPAKSSSQAPKLIPRKLGKNPDVDTSFLRDREREEHENELREQLRLEWEQKQEALKNEEIEIIFSYWDGSGHRRSLRMKKGNSIYQFLSRCLEMLRKEFTELRAVSGDQLMYVKEDLIIPHHYTFYDFIVTKARGKSGPLFNFDVHDDIRMLADSRVEKDESHAGKVLMRSWYERNKHIFPASRWEPFDPTKTYDKYSIHDRKKSKGK